jgi:benzoate/toluate 1,2-dioxygenase alpha subunit
VLALTNGLTALDPDELIKDERVHRLVYTDTAIFQEEMRRIFGRVWVFVGHESQVPYPGDYRTTNIGGQPILMSRDSDGNVYVMYNRCMHRGAIVCREESGNSKYFRCIYHGWTYASDGTLSGVPFRNGYPDDFDFGSLGLMRLPRVSIYRGFVFASLSSEGETLEDYLGPVTQYMDKIVDHAPEGEIEVRCGVSKYEYFGNWKLQAENFMDHYHAPFTHESIFVQRLGSQEGYKSWALNQKVRDGVEHRAFEHGHSVMDHPNWTRRHREPPSEYMAALQTGRGRDRAAQVMEGDIHIYVFPNLLFQESSQSYRVIRPVAVDRTEVFDYPYRLKGAPESYNDERVRGVSRWASATGTGQPDDLEAFSRVQEGLRAVGPEWVIFARGWDQDIFGSLGERISAKGTDETPMRGLYRYWKRLMAHRGSEP